MLSFTGTTTKCLHCPERTLTVKTIDLPELKIFHFTAQGQTFKVRAVKHDHFGALLLQDDVAKALGYVNNCLGGSNSPRLLPKFNIRDYDDTVRGFRFMRVRDINALLIRTRKANATAFREFVFQDVLPSLLEPGWHAPKDDAPISYSLTEDGGEITLTADEPQDEPETTDDLRKEISNLKKHLASRKLSVIGLRKHVSDLSAKLHVAEKELHGARSTILDKDEEVSKWERTSKVNAQVALAVRKEWEETESHLKEITRQLETELKKMQVDNEELRAAADARRLAPARGILSRVMGR